MFNKILERRETGVWKRQIGIIHKASFQILNKGEGLLMYIIKSSGTSLENRGIPPDMCLQFDFAPFTTVYCLCVVQ